MWRHTDKNMNTHKGPLQSQRPLVTRYPMVHEQRPEPRHIGLNLTTSVGVIVDLEEVVSPLILDYPFLLGFWV